MKLKNKKLIAKEGLIFGGFFLLFLISSWGSSFVTENFGYAMIISIIGYPIVLLFRFIIWAIKTLRKKEE
jgi:hypothetical protein